MPGGLQGYFLLLSNPPVFLYIKQQYIYPAVGYKSLSADVEWNGRYEPTPINKQTQIHVFTVLQNSCTAPLN